MANPGFPRGWNANSRGGHQPIIWPFFRKLQENEEILGRGGGSLALTLRSATADGTTRGNVFTGGGGSVPWAWLPALPPKPSTTWPILPLGDKPPDLLLPLDHKPPVLQTMSHLTTLPPPRRRTRQEYLVQRSVRKDHPPPPHNRDWSSMISKPRMMRTRDRGRYCLVMLMACCLVFLVLKILYVMVKIY